MRRADAHTGNMTQDKPVRTAVVIGPRAGGWAAYFGDQGGNVHAVDAVTGKAALDVADRGSPRRGHHRGADARRRDLVRAGFFLRGGHRGQPELFLLHLPRQRSRAGSVDRQGALEGVHDPGTRQAGRRQLQGRSTDGTVGGGGLVGADFRRSEPQGLRDHRRQLFGPAVGHIGRNSGVRTRTPANWRGRAR